MRVAVAVVVGSLVMGCAQKTQVVPGQGRRGPAEERPREVAPSAVRQSEPQSASRASSEPAPAPRAGNAEGGDPSTAVAAPPVPATPPETVVEPVDVGPPSWWHERPVREGERTLIAAKGSAPVLADARLAAMNAARSGLRGAMGREPRELVVERTSVYRDRQLYQVYVRVSGD